MTYSAQPLPVISPEVGERLNATHSDVPAVLNFLEAEIITVDSEQSIGPDPLIESIDPVKATTLDPLQARILELVSQSMGQADITDQLGISTRVLSLRITNITKKLGIEGPLAIQKELTDREHEVGVLAARGMSYKAMAAELQVSVSTIKIHLHNVYEKFGVSAAEGLVKKFRVSDEFIDQIDFSKLTPPERRVMELKSIGLGFKQVARRILHSGDSEDDSKTIAVTTARTHAANIYGKFPGLNNDTQLAQIGQGYIRKIASAASAVQHLIVLKLEAASEAEQQGGLDLSNIHRIIKIDNPKLLKFLAQRFYISPDMKEAGETGLHGLLAAAILGNLATRQFILDPSTEPIVEEIIDREISSFIKNR